MANEEQIKERRLLFRQLLNDFRKIDSLEGNRELPDSDTIVVLSAPETKGEENYLLREGNPENTGRIRAGISAAMILSARRAGKEVSDLTAADILKHAPAVILDGETEQLPAMKIRVEENGFPIEKIVEVNSGDRGKSHTGTQFSALNKYLTEHKEVTLNGPIIFVTSPYHQPRVARTAETKLLADLHYVVLGAPYKPPTHKVWGELNRMKRYIEGGDNTKSFTRGEIITGNWLKNEKV